MANRKSDQFSPYSIHSVGFFSMLKPVDNDEQYTLRWCAEQIGHFLFISH